MRTNNRIIVLLLAMTTMFVFAVNALAVGTAAGTLINNSATVNFQNAAGVAQTAVVSNTVTTTVQQVAAVSITNTAVTSINVIPGQIGVANQFTITNNGNYADKFWITPLTNASVANIKYYVNPIASATATSLDPAATLLTASGTDWVTPFINSTPASTTVPVGTYPNGTTIFVVVDIPNNTPAGTISKVQPVNSVKSVFTTSVSNAATVTMNDVVQVGALSIAKLVRNATTGTASAATATGVPGNTLEYFITVTNTGTGIAQNIIVSDNLDVNTTFVPGSVVFVSGTGTALQSGATALPNLVVNLGTGALATTGAGGSLAAGQTATFKFQVTIN